MTTQDASNHADRFGLQRSVRNLWGPLACVEQLPCALPTDPESPPDLCPSGPVDAQVSDGDLHLRVKASHYPTGLSALRGQFLEPGQPGPDPFGREPGPCPVLVMAPWLWRSGSGGRGRRAPAPKRRPSSAHRRRRVPSTPRRTNPAPLAHDSPVPLPACRCASWPEKIRGVPATAAVSRGIEARGLVWHSRQRSLPLRPSEPWCPSRCITGLSAGTALGTRSDRRRPPWALSPPWVPLVGEVERSAAEAAEVAVDHYS